MALFIKNEGNSKFLNLNRISYKNEEELRSNFINNLEPIFIDINTIEAKSFFSVKELDGVDVVLIGNDGSIFLVETKLATNSDARRVVAQILDYATKFKKKPFKYFENQVSAKFKETVSENLNKHFDNGNEVLNLLKENWDDGRFNLIIVMDKINEGINRMAEELKEKDFLIHGIELQKYSSDKIEAIESKIFWEKMVQSSPLYQHQIPNETVFINSYSNMGLSKQIKDFVLFFNEVEGGKIVIDGINTIRTPKYLKLKTSDSEADANLYFDAKSGNCNIDFWCKKSFQEKISNILKEYNISVLKSSEKSYGKVGRWHLKDFSKERFEEILRKISLVIKQGS